MARDAARVRSIFLAAVERYRADEWPGYLDASCGEDAALRERVEKLLAAHGGQKSLVVPAASLPGATVTHDSRRGVEQPGTTIGPYKLLEQIGEGGMGLVYMAEQQRPLRRLVALKIIKPGMDSRQVLARFEAEKQALALMDHENIARVFDAGTTDAGHPFFVMELVRGIPINEFCEQKNLTVRERLELFNQVCQAVQHAHQKGVIHRDLKPSNILVTMHDATAVPKVIDFGIAKALGPSLTEHTLHTGFAQLVGTPLYMSPEQAEMNQLGVDTRSDVYSLGVLLYELLTGTTPFDKEALSKSGLEEIRRMIREDEPPRPSARVSTLQAKTPSASSQRRGTDPRHVSAALRGELDWIVMKALEKDRGRRYESASAFATDIQRYLCDEPVLACPPSTMYRFHKFARKHRGALATAVAIAASLILGTAASAWQAVRATRAEAQANANAAQAQTSSQEAREKAQEASTQRDEAQRQRDGVKALNEKLAAKEQQLQRTLYAAHMNVAQQSWETNNLVRLRELLEQHRPKSAESDLRGFEWYYLYRLCHAELLTFRGHTDIVHGMAYSPDGHRLASGSMDNTVKVWDAQTGRELLSMPGHTDYVLNVAFSPDSKRLASASATKDKTVKVWDVQTGRELLSLKGHTAMVRSVAFSPDGNRLASAAHDRTVKVRDAHTGKELLSLEHADIVQCVAFSPDGKHLASGSGDKTIKVWDAQTGQELRSLKGHTHYVLGVVFSPDGKHLASAGFDGLVKIWDATTGQEVRTLRGHTDNVIGVAYSPDGQLLASGSWDQTVKVWDVRTGQELFTLAGHTGRVRPVAFSPDGQRLASASDDRTLKMWDAQTGQRLTLKGHNSPVQSVVFSPDSKCLASASNDRDNTAKVWDVQTGQELLSLRGHTDIVRSLAFSPDGNRLASASGDKTVKVWDAQTSQELFSLKGHTATVRSVVFSPDGSRLASASDDQTVKVWDAKTGRQLLSLEGHTSQFSSVAFSPDGKRLAGASGDKTVRIWDAQTGRQLRSLQGHSIGVLSVAYSPDGKRLASGSGPLGQPGALGQGGELKTWDSETGRELLTLKGTTHSVAFSPDGKRLVSGGGASRREVKVWDSETGQDLLNIAGRIESGNCVAFSPDGHRLASGGDDGTVKIYDATPLAEHVSEKPETPFWLLPRTALDLGSLAPAPVGLIAGPDETHPLALLQTGNRVPEADYFPADASLAPQNSGYRVVPGGLKRGAQPFGDRPFKIDDLPAAFSGLTLLQTKMGHKAVLDGRFSIILSALQPCYVFVALSEKSLATYEQQGAPSWLHEFTPTGHRIGAGQNSEYLVFVKQAPAGRIVFGPPCMDGESGDAGYFAFFSGAK
jgi:WD40 repeat protein/serine/threonine protein kinase